ncbi:MAG: transcriptional repressor [Chloroflexi bacterium]|nr:transcriptional repressor [Chloroflexota bacterium]
MNSKSDLMGEKIRAAFEANGQRQTAAKSQIAERLAKMGASHADFTVEKLWRELRRSNPHLGRATVFRAVEMLVSQGLLNRIDFPDGSHSYRACGDHHHHHITCVQCHCVVDIDICPPLEFDSIARQTDFVIEGHSLTLFGVCADCRKQK